MKTFGVTFNPAQFDAVFDALVDDVEAAARPAAQAGAQVLYDAVHTNVQKMSRTGLLARSIYQVFSQRNSGPGLATYHVSWNKTTARFAHNVEFGYMQRYAYYKDAQGHVRLQVRPEMRGKPKPTAGSRNRALLDAYYVTLPTPVHVPAHSFIRAAWASHKDRAFQAAMREFYKRLDGQK